MSLKQIINGAGEGDRTLATSLEGWGSTTELHPLRKLTQFRYTNLFVAIAHIDLVLIANNLPSICKKIIQVRSTWWRRLDLNQ